MNNNFKLDTSYIAGLFDAKGTISQRKKIWKMEMSMADRNVSLTHDTYKILISLSKVLLPDAKLSISKTIESIANEKAKKLNGKIKKI